MTYMQITSHDLKTSLHLRPKRNTRITTNLTDPVVFVPTLQVVLHSRKKIKRFSYLPDLKMFQEIGQKT